MSLGGACLTAILFAIATSTVLVDAQENTTSSGGSDWLFLGNFCPEPKYDNNHALQRWRSGGNMREYLDAQGDDINSALRQAFPDFASSGEQITDVADLAECVSICEFLGGGGAQHWSSFCVCAQLSWGDVTQTQADAFPTTDPGSGGLWRRISGGCPTVSMYSLDIVTTAPTMAPTTLTAPPTVSPTSMPSVSPSTAGPSVAPTSSSPTTFPSSEPTLFPSTSPTSSPSFAPTSSHPTRTPTSDPTRSPTAQPTRRPTTSQPTISPTISPTNAPTESSPTSSPTQYPTLGPTFTDPPTAKPTSEPTTSPSQSPSSTHVDLGSQGGDSGGGSSMIIIIAVVVVVVILIIIAICCYRKRGSRSSKPTKASQPITFEIATDHSPTKQSPSLAESSIAQTSFGRAIPVVTGPDLQPKAPRMPTTGIKTERVAPLDDDGFDALEKNHIDASGLPEGISVKTMNRYKNILPNPHSRVILAQIGDDVTTSYINANKVTSIDEVSTHYIAAQGPKPDCVLPFWRMLWQEKVQVIIMVTGLVEKGKSKCSRYWPDVVYKGAGNEGVMKYGDVIVRVLSAKQRAGYKVAELDARVGTESRKIMHFWFDSWPDFGVPQSSIAVVDMLRMANQYDPAHKNPWVVHCSAGIGRTGTFIGIDLGMKMIDRLNAVDTIMLIKKMRRDRGGMVQTRDQYGFLHTVLNDYHKEFGTTKHEESLYGNVNDIGSGASASPESLYGNVPSLKPEQVAQFYANVSVDHRQNVMYSGVQSQNNQENDYATISGLDDFGSPPQFVPRGDDDEQMANEFKELRSNEADVNI